jgi:hypothetical protein
MRCSDVLARCSGIFGECGDPALVYLVKKSHAASFSKHIPPIYLVDNALDGREIKHAKHESWKGPCSVFVLEHFAIF